MAGYLWWLIPAAAAVAFTAYLLGRRFGHRPAPRAVDENTGLTVAETTQPETPNQPRSQSITFPHADITNATTKTLLRFLSRLWSPAAVDFWWVRIPTRLRRYSVTLSAAWADGIYFTAWPRLAVLLSIFAGLAGFVLGVAHWSPYVIGDGSIATNGAIVVFAESLPFLFVAAVLGSLSSYLGLMLTLGYVVGDYLIAGPAIMAYRYDSAWPLFVTGRLPAFLCYWLLYMLAARTTLTAGSLALSALRSVRGNGTAAKILRVTVTAIFQFFLVYAWTLAAPMIFRVVWIWTGNNFSPITIPYYQQITTPWLPLAAAMAIIARGLISERSLSRPQILRRLRRLMQLCRYADAAPAFSRRLPLWARSIIAASALTFLISGILLSFEYAAAMFLAFAIILLVRALVLPKLAIWASWVRVAGRTSLAVRLSAGAVLVFLISRFVVAAPGPLNGQGKFGIELICLAIGLPLMLVLAADGEGARSSSLIGATQQLSGGLGEKLQPFKKAAATAVLLACLLSASRVYAFCEDDSCCLLTFAIAGLLVGALIILGIEFILPMMGIDLLAIIAEMFPGVAEFFGEDATAEEALQDLIDGINPDAGRRNCWWVADEVDKALADMFAGRPTSPFAPRWVSGVDPGVWMSQVQSEYGSFFYDATTRGIAEQLEAAGNGARGLIYVTDNVGAHAFNAVNYSGQVFFIDGQTGVVTTATDYLAGYNWAQVMFMPTF